MIKLYHGSDHVLKYPQYMGGKDDNDYGNGFYTTEYPERAESWAALNGNPKKSIVNMYELNTDDLMIWDLNNCGVLAGIAEVAANRGTTQEAAAIVGKRIVARYRADTAEYDLIQGYRADDSYTQVIEAFLMNQINVFEVEHLFYKGELGNQIFIKSEKAFERIRWTGAYEVELREEDKRADLNARREVNRFLKGRMEAILLDGFQVPGITARYAVQNELVYQQESGGYVNAGL